MTHLSTQSQCAAAYSCGPVKLLLYFEDPSLQQALDSLLSQYDAPWTASASEITVTLAAASSHSQKFPPATGSYLRSYRLHVDRAGSRLISSSNVGVWMEFDTAKKCALILVPDHPDRETVVEEVEQQIVLLLSRAWANAGWTPLHAGALIPPNDDRCIFICAPSGIGKTTLTTTMLCRGWQTLGDDKILLRKEGGSIIGRALSQRVHLHPSLSIWFPKLGDIRRWPHYSRWTDKRMVKIQDVWPDQLLASATPTAMVLLERAVNDATLELEPLDVTATLHTLLRQIAIPSDPTDARQLISGAAALSTQLRAARLALGNNIFANPFMIKEIEKSLLELLP